MTRLDSDGTESRGQGTGLTIGPKVDSLWALRWMAARQFVALGSLAGRRLDRSPPKLTSTLPAKRLTACNLVRSNNAGRFTCSFAGTTTKAETSITSRNTDSHPMKSNPPLMTPTTYHQPLARSPGSLRKHFKGDVIFVVYDIEIDAHGDEYVFVCTAYAKEDKE